MQEASGSVFLPSRLLRSPNYLDVVHLHLIVSSSPSGARAVFSLLVSANSCSPDAVQPKLPHSPTV